MHTITEYKLTGFDGRNQPIFQKIQHPIQTLVQAELFRCDCQARTQILFEKPYRCPDCGEWKL